jgi:hypothetical protein
MGKITIHCNSRRDADDMYAALEEFLEMHFPESYFREQRRVVTIGDVDAEDCCEAMISDGILDPELHDYTVEE